MAKVVIAGHGAISPVGPGHSESLAMGDKFDVEISRAIVSSGGRSTIFIISQFLSAKFIIYLTPEIQIGVKLLILERIIIL